MDIKRSAAALYAGGWRAADREELRREYDLTAEETAAICEELEKREGADRRA